MPLPRYAGGGAHGPAHPSPAAHCRGESDPPLSPLPRVLAGPTSMGTTGLSRLSVLSVCGSQPCVAACPLSVSQPCVACLLAVHVDEDSGQRWHCGAGGLRVLALPVSPPCVAGCPLPVSQPCCLSTCSTC